MCIDWTSVVLVNIFYLFFRNRLSILSCNSYDTLSKVEYSLSAPHTYIHINYWIFNRYSLILSNVQTNWIYKGKMEKLYELFILNIHSLNFDESMGGIQFVTWSWNFWNTIKPMDAVLCSVFSFFFSFFCSLKTLLCRCRCRRRRRLRQHKTICRTCWYVVVVVFFLSVNNVLRVCC